MAACAGPGVDVTVVVPCYNVERYLVQALESLRANTRCALEFLVVNDGSTDGSVGIMRDFERADRRFRVIDKKNEGYGASVNRGFSEARGTYLAILEPDDWVDAHMYDELFELATSWREPDIVKSSFWRVLEPDTPSERNEHCTYHHRLFIGAQPFTLHEVPGLLGHHPSIWTCLYKRSFLADLGIRLPEFPGAGWADTPFCMETLCRARSIVYTETPYYHYREELPGSSSATRGPLLPFERYEDQRAIVERYCPDDVGILRGLYEIGFNYVMGALDSGTAVTGEVSARIDRILRSMRPDIVSSMPYLRADVRALYEERTGHTDNACPRVRHLGALAYDSLRMLRYHGLGPAASRAGRYIRRRLARRESVSAQGRAAASRVPADVMGLPEGAPTLSVLIPIYNVEGYLKECLSSLAHQTFSDFEALCLDDGSTDGSSDVARDFCAKDDRFVYVRKDNSGYGATLNYGLTRARGRYVAILESDDALYPDAYRQLIGRAESDGRLRLVKGTYSLWWPGKGVDSVQHELSAALCDRLLDPRREQAVFLLRPAIWSAVYRRDFLLRAGIGFLETPGAAFQDTSFAFKVLASAPCAEFCDVPIVHYRQDRAGSSVNSDERASLVCGEFLEIGRWLDERPEDSLTARLCHDFQVAKLNAYLWNLDRLAPGLKVDFARRAAREFSEADRAGKIEWSRWAAWKARNLKKLMKDPVAYAKRRSSLVGNKPLFALALGGPVALVEAVRERANRSRPCRASR